MFFLYRIQKLLYECCTKRFFEHRNQENKIYKWTFMLKHPLSRKKSINYDQDSKKAPPPPFLLKLLVEPETLWVLGMPLLLTSCLVVLFCLVLLFVSNHNSGFQARPSPSLARFFYFLFS